MSNSATLVGIQVGQPRQYGIDDTQTDAMQQSWISSIAKTPITGPVWVANTNIQGDRQADLTVHGGMDKAVLAYSASHYQFWREQLQIDDMPYGGFGENLTLDGLDEQQVCLGDQYKVGSVLLEVSQPRQPCWKLARRWQIKTLVKQALQCGRLGWYFRVIQEGEIIVGDYVELIKRVEQQWTIAKLNDLFHFQKDDLESAKQLAECELLTTSWRDEFSKRVAGTPKSS